MDTRTHPSVGELIRFWRRERGLSQLEAALEVGLSSRHLSFVESGRANPSRRLIMRLARGLRIPLRETNDLLEAAGFARLFDEGPLDQTEHRYVTDAVRFVLEKHLPLPAVALDRHWNVCDANESAKAFFGYLLDGKSPSGSVIDRILDPTLLRPSILNLEELSLALLDRIYREAVGGYLDGPLREAVKRLKEICPGPYSAELANKRPLNPIVVVHFRKSDRDFKFFSVVTTIGSPRNVALEELRIESFFPTDDLTTENLREITGLRNQ